MFALIILLSGLTESINDSHLQTSIVDTNKSEVLVLKLVAQGDMPFTNIERLLSGDLYGKDYELIVAEITTKREAVPSKGGGKTGVRKGEILALEFRNGEWKIVWQYPERYIENIADVKVRGIAWTVGDTDNDGVNEILIFEQHALNRYQWNGNSFKKDTFTFPEIVDQAIVGDLDGKVGNELVTFSLSEITEDKRCYIDPQYTLAVWSLIDDKYELIWQDSKKMKYCSALAIPPDELVAVTDVENTGKNKLIVMHAQSDVSPSHYDFLVWENNSLKVDKSIVLGEGKIWKYSEYYSRTRPERTPFIMDRFHAVRLNNRTKLITRDHTYFNRVVIQLEKNGYKVLDLLPDGALQCDRILWVNLIGKGKGLLCIARTQSIFYQFKLKERSK